MSGIWVSRTRKLNPQPGNPGSNILCKEKLPKNTRTGDTRLSSKGINVGFTKRLPVYSGSNGGLRSPSPSVGLIVFRAYSLEIDKMESSGMCNKLSSMSEVGIKVKFYTLCQSCSSDQPLDPKPSHAVGRGQPCTGHLAEGVSETEIQLLLCSPACALVQAVPSGKGTFSSFSRRY